MSTLGPVSLAILEVIATSGGITAPEVARRLGRDPRSVHQAVSGLEASGCIAVATVRRRVGTAVKVWAATTHGRKALEAGTRDSLAGRSTTTPSDDGTRQVQDPAGEASVTALEAMP